MSAFFTEERLIGNKHDPTTRPPCTRRRLRLSRLRLRRRIPPDPRRGRLQHLHDRIPGDTHRPVLRRPDSRADLPAHRELWHQPAGLGVTRDTGVRVRRARTLRRAQPPVERNDAGRVSQVAGGSGYKRSGYPRRHPAPALQGRDDGDDSGGRIAGKRPWSG